MTGRTSLLVPPETAGPPPTVQNAVRTSHGSCEAAHVASRGPARRAQVTAVTPRRGVCGRMRGPGTLLVHRGWAEPDRRAPVSRAGGGLRSCLRPPALSTRTRSRAHTCEQAPAHAAKPDAPPALSQTALSCLSETHVPAGVPVSPSLPSDPVELRDKKSFSSSPRVPYAHSGRGFFSTACSRPLSVSLSFCGSCCYCLLENRFVRKSIPRSIWNLFAGGRVWTRGPAFFPPRGLR